MQTFRDEQLFWASKASDAHHNLLETIQASAGKWQAAIAGFLGLYATAGFVLGPDKLASLPVHGWEQAVVVAALVLAGVLGVVAIVFANLAAQGIPEILTGEAITGPRMREISYSRAKVARLRLGRAIKTAAGAGALAIATSTFLLVAGVVVSNHPRATLVGPGGAYCGELIDSNGRLTLRLPTGQTVSIVGGSLTRVDSC